MLSNAGQKHNTLAVHTCCWESPRERQSQAVKEAEEKRNKRALARKSAAYTTDHIAALISKRETDVCELLQIQPLRRTMYRATSGFISELLHSRLTPARMKTGHVHTTPEVCTGLARLLLLQTRKRQDTRCPYRTKQQQSNVEPTTKVLCERERDTGKKPSPTLRGKEGTNVGKPRIVAKADGYPLE